MSIVNSIRSNRKEKWKEIEEQNDFSFLAAFMQTQLEVVPIARQIHLTDIQVGSKEWQRAERLVERGVLKRGPKGRGYRISGLYEPDNPKPMADRL